MENKTLPIDAQLVTEILKVQSRNNLTSLQVVKLLCIISAQIAKEVDDMFLNHNSSNTN